MIKKLTILKLGGAVITHKKQNGGLNRTVVQRVAQEIKTALHKKPHALILVHGAGGKAHSLAHHFKLQKGAPNAKAIRGALQTHGEVCRLQQDIAAILGQTGLPVIPLPSGSLFYYQNDKLNFCGSGLISEILKKGWVPLLNGDMVVDRQKNFSILSGDTIAAVCAKKFGANLVLFATDVEGVYTSNPHLDRSARLLKNINSKMIQILSKETPTASASRDTTGEMMGKLTKLAHLPTAATIRIFNGRKPGNIIAGLGGKSIGTIITLR